MNRFLKNVSHSIESDTEPNYEEELFKIWCENILFRNFTKRQVKILGFIYLFSLHNKNLECFIPTLSSFEVAGLSRHKIKDEIQKLVELKVIEWNQETMIFKITTDVEQWKVDFVKKYTPQKIEQFAALNDFKFRPS